MERMTGLEPAPAPWQGAVQPLHHIRMLELAAPSIANAAGRLDGRKAVVDLNAATLAHVRSKERDQLDRLGQRRDLPEEGVLVVELLARALDDPTQADDGPDALHHISICHVDRHLDADPRPLGSRRRNALKDERSFAFQHVPG
jgi:hypothetical protein